MVTEETTANGSRLILSPNRSATWAQTRLVIFFVGGLSLLVAIFWAAMGAWIVLPFAGIEVSLLAYFCHRVCSDTYHREVIDITTDEIVIQWGKDYPKRQWRLARPPAQVIVAKAHHSMTPDSVTLADSRNAIAIGRKLNKEDVDMLIAKLKRFRLNVRVYGETQIVAAENYLPE